jgi:1-acyl-sn-glycerol-3-phosphate acyltransferase
VFWIGRAIGVASCVALYFPAQGLRCLFARGNKGYWLAGRINHWSGRYFLWVLGIRLRLHGTLYNGPHIVVSNHWGWLDPIALCSLQNLLYITSAMVRAHPFLGKVTALAGCQFVSRSPWSLATEISAARNATRQATLAFFPEATSSDGTQVLPFRSAFFEVAAGTNLKIQPLALRWSDPRAAWHGDMTFGPHLRTVLGLRNLMLEVHALEPIAVQAHDTRKDLCAQAERAIVDAMGITSTIC